MKSFQNKNPVASNFKQELGNVSPALLFVFIALAALGILWTIFQFAPFNRTAITMERDATLWPERNPTPLLNAEENLRVDNIVARMSVEEKVGQLIMADISTFEPSDLLDYPLGAILAGGNSAPDGKQFATQNQWLSLADDIYDAAKRRPDQSTFIPPYFAIDAVHGHNNVEGAILFPHNIGLGAADNPELMAQIGAATATAVAATGHDWTFSPTVAVAKDLRWGRTYESYSSDPARVTRLAEAYVRGLQGVEIGPGAIVGSAKHFVGDGGTTDGTDQGDTQVDEKTLVDVHAPGYYATLDAGVGTVMASYNSWNGVKMHGNEYLLTDILKDRMQFNGFVIGDWDAHAQVPRCNAKHCPQVVNAGVDMIMAPTKWKRLFKNTLVDVKRGRISQERLDDAVKRILAVKLKYGVLDADRPSARAGAGEKGAIASPALAALADDAVRQSLVLLKNDEQILPIRNAKTIAVIGPGADDFGAQSGGWTLTWQGDGHHPDNFPNGVTILDGLKAHAAQKEIDIVFNPTGDGNATPDLAIVVIHEPPYAEYSGDLKELALPEINDATLTALADLKAKGVPTVTILLSGRPLWVETQMAQSTAFVAAWLPGTQGGGVADLLFGETLEGTSVNFRGALSFEWPKDGVIEMLTDEPALFPLGFGERYEQAGASAPVSLEEDEQTENAPQ